MKSIASRRTVGFAVFLTLLSPGCATRSTGVRHGAVSIDTVEPDNAVRHEVADNEDFVVGSPVPDSRTLPAYPPALLGLKLPDVSVCIELNVAESGEVTEVRALGPTTRCADPTIPQNAAFVSAASEAARQWRFESSFACELPRWAPADGTCEGEGIEKFAVPMLRGYRFVFAQTAHGPAVRSEQRWGQVLQ